MNHADRLDLAIQHIPASSLAEESLADETLRQEAEDLLRDTAEEDGLWGKAEWYYFAGENGIPADVADQLWFWYHPDEYDGDLYADARSQARFDRPGVPDAQAEAIRRTDTDDAITSPEEAGDFLREYNGGK